MSEELVGAKWQERYGNGPPEWVDQLGRIQDIERAISDCRERINKFTLRLKQEQCFLELLLSYSGGPAITTSQEAAKSPPCVYSSEEDSDHSQGGPGSIDSLSRKRAYQQVDRRHERIARRVKQRVKDHKHWSVSELENVFNFEEEERESKESRSSKRVIHFPVTRQRSRSESSVRGPQRERENSIETLPLSPILDEAHTPDSSEQSQVKIFKSILHEPSSTMEIPAKRLSNGIHVHKSDDDDELMSSVKTVVASSGNYSQDFLLIQGTLPTDDIIVAPSTLKRNSLTIFDSSPTVSGDLTPTESFKEEQKPLFTRSLDLGIELSEVANIYRDDSLDDDEEEEEEKQADDVETSSIDNSGYHSAFQNLAESTLTYILRDTIFATSRSNSMSSLNESRRSVSPEPTTPIEGVNLRPNSGKKKVQRKAQILENDDFDEERLQRMLLEIQDSPFHSRSPSSPSSDLTQSDPSSPTHLIPYDICQTLSARSSRMYPVRRNTVVVHGEVLVIRKLVVAGIVTAEKAYIDCLNVAKEFYRKPLLALCSTTQPIISERDVNTIFYRVEDLHSLHSSLHGKLERLLSDWGIHSCVGDFFLELCKNLKLYKDYVEMYRRSLDCLERSKVDPNFKKFLDDVKVTVSSQFKDVPNVNELLRKPIERLQSYSLVLTDLCQHTPESHNDFSVLKQSLNVMSDFIASTHDPRAFQQLSGGFNRELVKQELVVELLERSTRKIRRLFLFHDVLVSAKEKSLRHGEGVRLEPKWYLPLHDLKFHPPGAETIRPVPVTSDHELGTLKSRIAELKAQLNRDSKERRNSTLDKDASFKRNFKFMATTTKPEKLRKKLQEQQVAYWMASPSLPLRLFANNGKRYVFLLHNEDERESWISAIKKLQPKAVQSVSLSQFELQDLLSRQKVHLTRDQEEVIEVHTDEDEYLSGILRVHVTSAKDLKTKQNGLHCGLEFDEYSRFDRKARTLPANVDWTTLMVTWDQDFEIEVVGTHIIKVMIFYKYLLKEEVCATGKMKLPIKTLKANKRHRLDIPLHPQGSVTLVLEYFTSLASIGKKPALLSSGVFGFSMDVIAKREHHSIPLIVQTCVDEVERRGLSEVGIYRVAGVLRDVQELREAFDTDYIHAQQLAYDTDIHAVAGLLKRYFRELPDPLFTDELYMSFVQALALADPEAREQSLVTLLHSLPNVNFKTAVFLFKHLRKVAADSELNKMNLNNLATVFGPNLLRPGTNHTAEAAWDVISPVNVLMFFLTCPMEVYDDPMTGSAPNSESKGGSKKRSGLPLAIEDDSTSVTSAHSTGFVTASTSTTSSSPLPTSPSSTIVSISSGSPSVSSNPLAPTRFKQSVI